MNQLIIAIIVVIVLIIAYVAYKIHKGEKQDVLNILLSIQHDLDEYFKSESGKKVKQEVLIAAGTYLSNYAGARYKGLKPIFNFVFNKFVLSRMIESNMSVIKKVRADKNEIIKEQVINQAINFGITKGTELLVNETKNVSVGGDNSLTYESQLVEIASKLNLEAKDKGFVGAYAEFKSNLKDTKELRTGAIAGLKF